MTLPVPLPNRDLTDAELVEFLSDCARQTWSASERRVFDQLIRRLATSPDTDRSTE